MLDHATVAYLQIISFKKLEVCSHHSNAFSSLCLDAVDALVIVAIIGRVIGWQQDTFDSNRGGSTLS